ncbi:hypothetical protein J008_01590 [Cryptococcus neoformans]|uniref:Transmembrane protein 14 n=2 Tax=Cryptococcus neoformans TaxID=5207 RepID=A0A854QGT8_CRYNE|nr:hypothetical protein CNAG_02978 [Cryptococcus neoformans var. grubii H99]AUB23285.1 hypothetical protein CKF44_02978 [Cryptococcus neoformans var. grubii]OWT40907.1 hypothetical protein C362_01121 [Cryptococcus neoformans var. grubii Bt1]OWZ34290.1 hypothetical protein C347_01674 [Cryptococcus neoformans var. grubii AD2-60a]OWZ46374.1 hypothetical protein C343_01605 [Cryptococcus neoformans var. grubii C23]OWZ49617.1 hypothetical protein C353_01620 [Cryptococcus neoformans var. grubii AD1-8|eukprot:XP_012048256.1 hypothetical protein CNAG_02978 [Cryptococcus neoformans var. grubii H99]
MSSKPISALSGLSVAGGIVAYTRYSSFPALVASLGIGSAMMISGMRIRDGMDYGYESAAASSATLMYPTIRRFIKTRARFPATLALLATASTAYYLVETFDGVAQKPVTTPL